MALSFEDLPSHVCIGYQTLIKKNTNDVPYCYQRECRKMWKRAASELSAHPARLKEALSEFNTTIKHASVMLSISLAISVSGMLQYVYFPEKCKRHCVRFSPPCSILKCCFLPKQFYIWEVCECEVVLL